MDDYERAAFNVIFEAVNNLYGYIKAKEVVVVEKMQNEDADNLIYFHPKQW